MKKAIGLGLLLLAASERGCRVQTGYKMLQGQVGSIAAFFGVK